MKLTHDEAVATTWYDTGYSEFAEYLCSELDPFAPQHTPMFWVPKSGGLVTADVRRELTEEERERGLDPWTYDVPTGVVLTPEELRPRTCTWERAEAGAKR